MSFGDSYLKHLEVLGNVGMTGIEPVEYNGQQIVPIQFLKSAAARPGFAGAAYRGQDLHRLLCAGYQGWPAENRLHLQHL